MVWVGLLSGLSAGQGDIEKNALMVKIEVLANALLTLSIFGAIIGFLEMVNAGYTVYMIAQKITVNDGQHYIISIALNVMLGIYSMIMGLCIFK